MGITVDFNPRTSPEPVGCGYIINQGSVYATVRSATTGTDWIVSSTTPEAMNGYTSSTYYIRRIFYIFDTSSLPDTCTITNATMSVRVRAAHYFQPNAGQCGLYLYEGTQAENTTAADFDSFNSTLLSDDFTNWSFANFSDTDYSTITMNTSGLAIINKTGVTKLCLRLFGDVNNSTPTDINYVDTVYTYYGESYYPKLSVTYSTQQNYTPAALTPKLGMRYKYPVLYKNGIQIPNPSGSGSAKDGLHVSEGRKATFKRNSYLRDMG